MRSLDDEGIFSVFVFSVKVPVLFNLDEVADVPLDNSSIGITSLLFLQAVNDNDKPKIIRNAIIFFICFSSNIKMRNESHAPKNA